MSRLFHPASVRVRVSHSLLCYFVLSLKKVSLKYGTALAALPGWGPLSSVAVEAAGCHGDERPARPGAAPWLRLPWESPFPAGELSCLCLAPTGDWNVLALPDVIGDYRMRVVFFSLKGYHGILKYISALMWKNIHSWSSEFLLLIRVAFPSSVPMSEHKYHTGLS